jgi:HAD superfamily hydrolase (TIGR01509 family)
MGVDLPPDLVIFDCDGVLVDSEPIANRVLAEHLTEAGYPITAAECERRFTGLRFPALVAEIEAETGRPLPPALHARVHERTLSTFSLSLKPIPGIAQVVDGLQIPYCVASSSSPPRIRHSLTVTGLIGLFEPHLFSAAMVARGKPFPDLFLYAAREMGVPPARCVVIEDSVPGVTAAHAAGMAVIGFVGGGHARHDDYRAALRAAGADRIIDDMRLLPGMLSANG